MPAASYLPPEVGGTVITVGTFDGVHQGHKEVLEAIHRRAESNGLKSLLVTFSPHPLQVVNPDAAPHLLTLDHERREILAQLELDYLVVMRFTRELSRLSPREFVELLITRFKMRELVIGHDHGFGRNREGDENVLRELGRELAFQVDVVDSVQQEGRPISSTLVRRAVAGGDLGTAARLLGRPYSLTAPVTSGAGRGREIGYPTINLELPEHGKLLPPDGVYAVEVEWRGGWARGMMHQGPRPTFHDGERSLEVHLLDVQPELYGQRVKVFWVRRLRDVMSFASADALRRQLGLDREAARRALTHNAVMDTH